MDSIVMVIAFLFLGILTIKLVQNMLYERYETASKYLYQMKPNTLEEVLNDSYFYSEYRELQQRVISTPKGFSIKYLFSISFHKLYKEMEQTIQNLELEWEMNKNRLNVNSWGVNFIN